MDAIEFILEPSSSLVIALVAGHAAALGVIFTLPLSLFLQLTLSWLLIFFYFKIVSLHAKKTAAESIIKIWQTTEGSFGCETTQGKKYKVAILRDSYVSALCIVLRLQRKNAICTLVVPFDSLSQEEYRILCTRLTLTNKFLIS